jgi:hypothetical protein
MKKAALLSLSLAVILMSCGGGSPSKSGLPNQERLQGAWEIISATGDMSDLNVGTVYAFEGDNMTTSKGAVSTEGTFTSTDSTITWSLSGMDMEVNYDYSYKGENMVIELGGQALTFEAK